MIKLVDILNEADIDKCPAATQNIELNLQNRQKAIKDQGYGPLNLASSCAVTDSLALLADAKPRNASCSA